MASGVWNPPNRGAHQARRRSHSFPPAPRWRIQYLRKGPSEISASVKAYFALKLAGVPVDDPRMARLRERILALGGIQAANSYTKVNLSLFGLYPREGTPSIPPEIMLLPGKLLYQMSSWTRAIIVSLAIVHAHDPQRPVPAGFNLDEIFIPGREHRFRQRRFLAELAQDLHPVRQNSQAVGPLRLRPHPQSRPAQMRALDAGAHETRRWPRRHLSADAVFHHGARRSGLSAGSSGPRGGPSPVRII